MHELSMAAALTVALEAQKEGKAAAIVTVIANRSDLPIQPSARMVVVEGDEPIGVLHPALDSEVTARAADCLARQRSRMQSFQVRQGTAGFIGTQGGDVDLFIEVLATPPHLVIAGAGHIALPLARMAKLIGFRLTVIDDREAFANRERFPEADEILVGAYVHVLQGIEIDRDTFIVLVTRGHVHDSACLHEVLQRGAGYIGMIGSKRRVRTVLDAVPRTPENEGELARVHAPIGLDIGAQTPEEIALAVMAEVVKARRGGSGRSLSLREPANV